ncbi:hypothetical protein BKA56DRAFT_14620 [Ilyonectria sp. MPI-CAGE-AT-0026]|nr:hypothetical protein BKA56DRAFT_14620 [Ilyonectria sp. MPI-CAGE-AT-0026]
MHSVRPGRRLARAHGPLLSSQRQSPAASYRVASTPTKHNHRDQPVAQPASRRRSTTAVKASGPIPSRSSSATGPRRRQQLVSSIDRGSGSQLADQPRGFKPALSLSAQQLAASPPSGQLSGTPRQGIDATETPEASLSKPVSTSTGSAPCQDETCLLLLDVVDLLASSDPSPFLSCLFSPLPPSPIPRRRCPKRPTSDVNRPAVNLQRHGCVFSAS